MIALILNLFLLIHTTITIVNGDGLRDGALLFNSLSDPNSVDSVVKHMAKLGISYSDTMTNLIQAAVQANNSIVFNQTASIKIQFQNSLHQSSAEYQNMLREMDWSFTSVAFNKYEKTILALKESILQVLQAPEAIRKSQMQYFITTYENENSNAALKLYEAVVETKGHMFGNNLLSAARRHTDDDRLKVRLFLSGVYRLILDGLEVETTYLTFIKATHASDYLSQVWANKLKKYQAKMVEVDNEIKRGWMQNSRKTIEHYINSVTPNDRNTYATNLYDLLRNKFDWREWIVLVYDPIRGYDNHAMTTCDGTYFKFSHRGNNIVVASTDPSTSKFDRNLAFKKMDRLPTEISYSIDNWPEHLLTKAIHSVGTSERNVCDKKEYALLFFMNAEGSHVLKANKERYQYALLNVESTYIFSSVYYWYKTVYFG